MSRLQAILDDQGQGSHLLLYRPPCGKWYVHSHKLYPNQDEAADAAIRFLPPEVPFEIIDLRAMAAAVAEEREACAKVADDGVWPSSVFIATAIRARTEGSDHG